MSKNIFNNKLFIGIIVFFLSLLFRLPRIDSILINFDPLQIFFNGSQFFQTNPFNFTEWYRNSIARLLIFNYHGISNISMSFINFLLLYSFNLKLAWWNYFLVHHIMSSFAVVFFYLTLYELIDNKINVFLFTFLWLLNPASVFSATHPTWIPFTEFFTLGIFYLLVKFLKTEEKKYLIFATVFLSVDILGDVLFPVNIILYLSFLIYYIKQNGFYKIKKISIFFILPFISVFIIVIMFLLSIKKGYPLGLLGYIWGHKPRVNDITLVYWILLFNFIRDIIVNNGLIFIVYIISIYYCFKTILRRREFLEKIVSFWSLLLLFPTLFFLRADVTITLIFIPLTFSTILLLFNRMTKVKLFLLFSILISNLLFVIDQKFDIFSINYYYKNVRKPSYKEVPLLSITSWVKSNTTQNDSILVITPHVYKNFSHMDKGVFYSFPDMSLVPSISFYSNRVYTYAKGKSDKTIFTNRNLFNGHILYNKNSPPKYIISLASQKIDESFFSNNEFLQNKYKLGFLIKNKDRQTIARIYLNINKISNKDFDIVELSSEDLEQEYLEKYLYARNFAYSPYQGLWYLFP